jgi:hypothetical protein
MVLLEDSDALVARRADAFVTSIGGDATSTTVFSAICTSGSGSGSGSGAG